MISYFFLSPLTLWSLFFRAPGFNYYSMKKALRPEKGRSLFRRNALYFHITLSSCSCTFSADLIAHSTNCFHQISCRAKLLAKGTDMYIYGSALSVEFISPDLI